MSEFTCPVCGNQTFDTDDKKPDEIVCQKCHTKLQKSFLQPLTTITTKTPATPITSSLTLEKSQLPRLETLSDLTGKPPEKPAEPPKEPPKTIVQDSVAQPTPPKSTEAIEDTGRRIMRVPLGLIHIPQERATSVLDEEEVTMLRESMREEGQKDPIKLLNVNGELWLSDGLNRIKAAYDLGWQSLEADIKEGTMKGVLISNVITNAAHGDKDPVGMGISLLTLTDPESGEMTLSEAARACGIAESTARKYMRIARMPEQVRTLVRYGKLSRESAYQISFLPDESSQVNLAVTATGPGWTAEAVKQKVRQTLDPTAEQPPMRYDFSILGEPVRKGPMCQLCGIDCQTVPYYVVYLCRNDWDAILEGYKLAQAEEEKKRQQQQPPTSTPETPNVNKQEPPRQ